MDVGNYIKTLREANGYSQEELGRMVGVQKSAVNKWEKGIVKNLKRETILKLSDIFNVNPARFIDEHSISTESVSYGMFQIRLKELREDKGLSQGKLGKQIGVAQSTVGMWENGTNKPENSKLVALANFFNVSTDYLLGKTNVKNAPADDETDEDKIKFALFGGDAEEITDEMFEDVKRYAQFLKERNKYKK